MILNNENQATNWAAQKQEVERIIKEYPKDINPFRNKNDIYEVTHAYNLIYQQKAIDELELKKLGEEQIFFSESGREELISILESLDGVAIAVIPPFSFVVGKTNDTIFLIDAHRVQEECDGNGNGIIKVFPEPISAARWIWKRMYSAGQVVRWSSEFLLWKGSQPQMLPEPQMLKRVVCKAELS